MLQCRSTSRQNSRRVLPVALAAPRKSHTGLHTKGKALTATVRGIHAEFAAAAEALQKAAYDPLDMSVAQFDVDHARFCEVTAELERRLSAIITQVQSPVVLQGPLSASWAAAARLGPCLARQGPKPLSGCRDWGREHALRRCGTDMPPRALQSTCRRCWLLAGKHACASHHTTFSSMAAWPGTCRLLPTAESSACTSRAMGR